jgi:hypothetical protein
LRQKVLYPFALELTGPLRAIRLGNGFEDIEAVEVIMLLRVARCAHRDLDKVSGRAARPLHRACSQPSG